MANSSEREKIIKESIDPVSIEATKKIIDQMEKCVCKINFNNEIGTGFFAKIFYKSNELKVLITNFHDINKNSQISIYLNNKERKKIEINNYKRKIYKNIYYNISIIEIIENFDGIYEYLELNDDIENNLNLEKNKIIENYRNLKESIYILNYLKGENIVVSYGLLNEIKSEKEILHKCYTDNGSSGSPILSLRNNKLIGIHSRKSKNLSFNIGALVIFPIIEYIQNYYNTSDNLYKNNFNNNKNNYSNNINNPMYINNINIKNPEINQLNNMKGLTEVNLKKRPKEFNNPKKTNLSLKDNDNKLQAYNKEKKEIKLYIPYSIIPRIEQSYKDLSFNKFGEK